MHLRAGSRKKMGNKQTRFTWDRQAKIRAMNPPSSSCLPLLVVSSNLLQVGSSGVNGGLGLRRRQRCCAEIDVGVGVTRNVMTEELPAFLE